MTSDRPAATVLRVVHHGVVHAWRERERELRRRGFTVAVLSARRWNEGGREIALERPERWVRGVSTAGRHPALFLYDPRPLWRALGARPDLLDIHEEPFALATAEILLMRLVRRRRVPYVLYSAQNIEKRYPFPFGWLERLALRGAAGAYVCNAEAGAILVRKGLRGPARVIGLGVDTDRFRPGERSPGGGPVIGYVGRLEQRKGVEVLLAAAALRPDWTVRITGAGPDEETLRRMVDERGLAGRVVFLGHASGDDLAERYRELDVLAVPSIPTPSWTEQFGRVAVEAMASGVPVVASTAGALPEVVGDAGVLVAPADPEALAAGVDAALDPDHAADLRRRGLARARVYSWKAVAALQAALYEEVLAGPAS